MNCTTSLLSKALLGLALFIGLITSAQTPDQVQKITSTYNQAYLKDLAAQSLEKSTKEKQAAIEYAKARNLPISYTTKEGSFVDLQRVLPDGTLIYYTTFNVNAAKSTRTNHINIGGSTGFNLDGQNMTAHVWDGGHPRVTHQEYYGPGGSNRVTIEDGATQLHYHAAHVVGTITASGVQANAKGMAPRSRVKAYQWDNDLSEATTAASNGMLLSNHSYGYGAERLPDDMFGAYREDARNWDNLMFNAPYYLMVVAAGNDGNVTYYNGQPFQSGYDMLSGHATSKNNLVVANAQDANVDSNGNLISVAISSSSSQGPTDDFRIKPDIAGNGAGVYSTYDNSNTAYNTISGTSMASPNVTGSLLLLQEHYNNVYGSFMRAATLKGLALHTADDAGAPGPDARFGWGLLNAKRAAETISKNGSEALVQEMVLSQGQTITLQVDSDGFNDLMASISWTDRPGSVNNGTNSTTPALVNDLDIRVTKGTTTYYPWKMTSATSNRNDGDNNVDPFERIEVENASGTYTITITHKGTLTGGSQAFSLIVTGLQVECITATTPQDVNVNDITGTTATASWTHIPGALSDLRYRETGSSTWTVVSDIHESHYEIIGLEVLTEYEVQVRSKCSEGTPSAYSTSVNFTTTDYTYCDSQSSNALTYFHISNVNLNTINHTSAESTYSDFTNISTDLAPNETYTITITPTTDSPDYGTSYAVWIDYNRNGVFEPSERVFAVFTIADDTPTGTFTVPADADLVSTRMRVSLKNSTVEEIPGPCDTFDFGEVEDYTINVTLPISGYVYENGVWTPGNPSGIATATDDITVINGETTLTANTDVNNLTIHSEATLNIDKVLNLYGDLTIDGSLVFKSNSSGNGELGFVSTTSSITGNATVQNYMSAIRSYRMVSSAVTTSNSIKDHWQEGVNNTTTNNNLNPNQGFGTHITGSTTGANGFDATISGNPSIFTVNVAEQQFEALGNTDTNTLTAGDPYLLFVRGGRNVDLSSNSSSPTETTLRATGALHTGNHTQNFNATASTDLVMFGNPYQSGVDINQVLGASTNVNTNYYYVYDPNGGTRGAYITVSLPTGINISGSEANNILQPGQGAQVAVNNAGPVSINFQETHKIPGQPTNTSATGNALSMNGLLSIQLYTADNFNNQGSVHDSFGIIFADGYDNALTNKDAIKPMNFDENLGRNHNGNYLSVEQRTLPEEAEILPLYTDGYKHNNYVLNMNVDGLDEIAFYLDDYYTGQSTLINQDNATYSFSIDPSITESIATDRFAIRIGERLSADDFDNLSDLSLYPNPMTDQLSISNPKNIELNKISIYDITGRLIHTVDLTGMASEISLDISSLSSATYMVVVSGDNGEVSKIMVKE